MLVKSFNLKKYILSIALPLAVGGAAAFITAGKMDIYSTLNQPFLAPPAWLFPVVWTILYILIGTAEYFAKQNPRYKNSNARKWYLLQLGLNFLWPIVFFGFSAYKPAVLFIFLLWAAAVMTLWEFFKIDKTAAYLFIPYILWISFAAYLNTAIAVIN
ncbi:MAG: tryptophan-rich sensory protein [Clostridia bacterium]|nr:tryptophan-rich sensory protein [Clostridia bacterium]